MQWIRGLIIKIVGLIILPLCALVIASSLVVDHCIAPFRRPARDDEEETAISRAFGDIFGKFIEGILYLARRDPQ